MNSLTAMGYTGISAQTLQQKLQLTAADKQQLVQYITWNGSFSIFQEIPGEFAVNTSRLAKHPHVLNAVYGPRQHARLMMVEKPSGCTALAWATFLCAITGNELGAAVGGLGLALYC